MLSVTWCLCYLSWGEASILKGKKWILLLETGGAVVSPGGRHMVESNIAHPHSPTKSHHGPNQAKLILWTNSSALTRTLSSLVIKNRQSKEDQHWILVRHCFTILNQFSFVYYFSTTTLHTWVAKGAVSTYWILIITAVSSEVLLMVAYGGNGFIAWKCLHGSHHPEGEEGEPLGTSIVWNWYSPEDHGVLLGGDL